jgi:cytochrome c nitrite reductase small subunit
VKKKVVMTLLVILALLILGIITEASMTYTSKTEFCINCHVMKGQHERWQRSSHSEWAGCSDCHVPHNNLPRKLVLKARDGLRDVYVFTLGEVPENIEISKSSTKTVKQNCLSCHEDLMSGVNTEGRVCWDCHRDLPHGF